MIFSVKVTDDNKGFDEHLVLSDETSQSQNVVQNIEQTTNIID